MKKIINEIKTVGFIDWIWFVLYLRRDEFSPKLCITKYYPDMVSLMNDRERAHRIDEKLKAIK